MYRSSRNTKWFDDIIEDLVTKLIPVLEQGIDDFIDHPIVEVLGISDIFRCADGQEGHYCIYAAAGVIPIPAGKLPRVLSFLRSARVPNRLSAAATRFSDDAARFARYMGARLPSGVAVNTRERTNLERICRGGPRRYIFRPALSEARWELTDQASVSYALKTAYQDGTTHVVFDPDLHRLARYANASYSA